MKRISRELRRSSKDRYVVTEPAAHVSQGETFIVEAATCVQPVVRSKEDCLNFIEREETGPIYIDGIKAGDMIRVEIKDIKVVGHATGAFRNGLREFMEIKPEENIIVCHGNLPVPIEPMIGVICVVPAKPADVSHDLGDCGGNMDYRDIMAGTSICFKARHDGGLLYLGDLHAYQGWGEWLGVGCECAGDVTISITKENYFISERPVLLKKNSYTCIASRVVYGEAVALAIRDAADILKRMTGVSDEDAHSYCKLVGNGMNGQMWQLPYPTLYSKDGSPVKGLPSTVGIEIPTDILRKHGKIPPNFK